MFKTIATLEGGIQVPMTDEEIAEFRANEAAYLKELARTKYASDRRAAYPPIADQLDMMYHSPDAWHDAIAAIKAKYPKL
jgi:hypothetical protein